MNKEKETKIGENIFPEIIEFWKYTNLTWCKMWNTMIIMASFCFTGFAIICFLLKFVKLGPTLLSKRLFIFNSDSGTLRFWKVAGTSQAVAAEMSLGKENYKLDHFNFLPLPRVLGSEISVRPTDLRRSKEYVVFYHTWVWGFLTGKEDTWW